MTPLTGARIVLGVAGGIAAYKAADLSSKLVQAGADVDVVLTAGARRFVAPPTFNALTRRPVHDDLFAPWTADSAGHISLAAGADLLIVAPATADTIARLAQGRTDDLLGAIVLSTEAPLLLAPAMEHRMFHHPATQRNLDTLRAWGATVVGPAQGRLASGASGDGRLADVATLVGAARQILGRNGRLAGKRVVISAAGTHEPIDPVRFVGNRSSGAMGYALTQAALDRGAAVTLVSGPTHLTPPYGAVLKAVETAEHMLTAIEMAVDSADVLIMAAAVADFRPATSASSKIKKQPGQTNLTIELVRNPDILATVKRPGLLKIGFAAETDDLIANAEAKLVAKGLAMIVANEAVATIGQPDSAATILAPNAAPEVLPRMAKEALAEAIVDRVASLIESAHERAR